MCKELHVSRSGFYNFLSYQKNPKIKEVKDEEDFKLIKQAYDYKNRHKGARQIKMTLLNTFEIVMNLKKIRRLMKKYGLYCPIRKANPYRRMVKAMKTNNYASNKLSRNFKTSKPGEHLLTDITYIFYGKDRKLCYCSTIKDASTNEILAKEYSESLEIKFVLDTVSQLKKCKFIGEITEFVDTKVKIRRLSPPDVFVTPEETQDYGEVIISPDDVVGIIISKHRLF